MSYRPDDLALGMPSEACARQAPFPRSHRANVSITPPCRHGTVGSDEAGQPLTVREPPQSHPVFASAKILTGNLARVARSVRHLRGEAIRPARQTSFVDTRIRSGLLCDQRWNTDEPVEVRWNMRRTRRRWWSCQRCRRLHPSGPAAPPAPTGTRSDLETSRRVEGFLPRLVPRLHPAVLRWGLLRVTTVLA